MSTCPRCQRELIPFFYDGIELLKCSECKGFWFGGETFRDAKQRGFAGLQPEETPDSFSEPSSPVSPNDREMMCPECSIPMSSYNYAYSSDIYLHRCTTCKGIWADISTLLRIETLLNNYKESLDEAKAKAIPLMLHVKKRIQEEEKRREEERKQAKKQGFFKRFFRRKGTQEHRIEDIFEEFHKEDDDQESF